MMRQEETEATLRMISDVDIFFLLKMILNEQNKEQPRMWTKVKHMHRSWKPKKTHPREKGREKGREKERWR